MSPAQHGPATPKVIASERGRLVSGKSAMRMVKFEQIDEQGKRERDIHINPEHVRSLIALPDYGKNKRSRITFSADDGVLVRGTVEEVLAALEGRATAPPTQTPPLHVVEGE